MRVEPPSLSPLSIILSSALVLLLTLAAGPACAQAYKWVDEQGRIHFTDNPTDVPLKYRDRLEKRDLPAPAPRTDRSARGGESSDDALRDAIMRKLDEGDQANAIPLDKRRAIAGIVQSQFWWLVIGGLVNFVVSVGLLGHALVKQRWIWAILNFFTGISTPFYACSQLESPVPVRLAIVGLWLVGPIATISLYLDITRALVS